MNVLDKVQDFLKNPEGDGDVASKFFTIGLQVFFAGVWFIIFRRLFGQDVLR